MHAGRALIEELIYILPLQLRRMDDILAPTNKRCSKDSVWQIKTTSTKGSIRITTILYPKRFYREYL